MSKHFILTLIFLGYVQYANTQITVNEFSVSNLFLSPIAENCQVSPRKGFLSYFLFAVAGKTLSL